MARAALLAKFRQAAIERIRRLNLAFLELEKNPDAAETEQEALREIHTLKGEARLVGLADVSDAAQRTEEVIFHARKSRFRVAQPVHDAILAGLDLMTSLLHGVSSPEAISEYASRTEPILAAAAAPPKAASATTPVAAVEGGSTGEDAFRALVKAGHEGWITVDLAKMDALTNVVGDLVEDQSRREKSLGVLSELVQEWRDELHLASALADKVATGLSSLDVLQACLARQRQLDRRLRSYLLQARERSFEQRLHVDEGEGRLRDMRMTPVSSLFTSYLRGARDLAHELGKLVRVDVSGETVGADKRVLDEIAEPVLHLVRNAVDHGIEKPEARKAAGKPAEGRLMLEAHAAGGRLLLTVSDDGAGLDVGAIGRAAVGRGLVRTEELAALTPERVLALVFREGFSTRTEVSAVSGRGVGLDVAKQRVENLGGSVSVRSERGQGATFTIDVPLSLSLVEVLLFRAGGITYALPTSCLDRVLTLSEVEVLNAAGGEVFHLVNEIVPIADLAAISGTRIASALPEEEGAARMLVVVNRGRKLGLRVAAIAGYRSLVQREIDRFLEGLALVAGTALLGEGALALVLDPQALLAAAESAVHVAPRSSAGSSARRRRSILLVDDSEITRLLLAEVFARLGYEVREAGDGRRALEAMDREVPDLILLDLDMPVMTGFEFLQHLRAEERGAHVPVVVFSSRGSDEDKRRSVALGASAYLVKSRFQEADLVDTVQRFLPEDGS